MGEEKCHLFTSRNSSAKYFNFEENIQHEWINYWSILNDTSVKNIWYLIISTIKNYENNIKHLSIINNIDIPNYMITSFCISNNCRVKLRLK